MTRIKNVSSGTRTIASLGGTTDVAPGTEVDLLQEENGVPRNTPADLGSSTDLRDAFKSGDWRAVTPDGRELGEEASLASLAPASASSVEALVSTGWVPVLPVPGNQTWFDIYEIHVAEEGAVPVAVTAHMRVGAGADMDVGAIPYTFTARRRTGEGAEAPSGFSFAATEGGIRFRLDNRPTSVVIQGRRRGAAGVEVQTMGMIGVEQ